MEAEVCVVFRKPQLLPDGTSIDIMSLQIDVPIVESQDVVNSQPVETDCLM